jgi:hypothetical protein
MSFFGLFNWKEVPGRSCPGTGLLPSCVSYAEAAGCISLKPVWSISPNDSIFGVAGEAG